MSLSKCFRFIGNLLNNDVTYNSNDYREIYSKIYDNLENGKENYSEEINALIELNNNPKNMRRVLLIFVGEYDENIKEKLDISFSEYINYLNFVKLQYKDFLQLRKK